MSAEGSAVTASEPSDTATVQVQSTRGKHVEALVTLAKSKGPACIGILQRKIASGESLTVKGMTIGPDVLKEAVDILAKDPAMAAAAATPTPARSQAPTAGEPADVPVAATSAAGAGTRWTPPAPSAAALAAKAALEYENAKPFNRSVKIVGGAKVALLSKPDIASTPTGEYLQDGQTGETVVRILSPRDGRVYLRMKGSNGWLSTRSRKSFAKIVVAPASGDPLEPPDYADAGESVAVDVLQAVDSEGREMKAVDASGDGAHGGSAASKRPARSLFRTVISRCPVLSTPNIAVATNSSVFLQLHDKFEADAVHYNPSENRAYLRLADGSGWVCERSRASFHRFATEPLDARSARLDEGTKRMKSDDGKVIILHRSGPAPPGVDDETAGAAAPRGGVPKPGQEAQLAVFRSDEEMWPKELRPAKPVLPAVRQKMRRLYMFHGKRIVEAEKDMKEANEQADTYARSCPAEKELRQFVEGLKKEIAKYQKAWTTAVQELLASQPQAGASA